VQPVGLTARQHWLYLWLCCFLSVEWVPCSWESFSHSVSTWRSGLDMDTHMSYFTSESRHFGTGSVPQSSTSSWYSSAAHHALQITVYGCN